MSKAARKTRRHSRHSRLPKLPQDLRTFDGHLDADDGQPTGLRDFLSVISHVVGTDDPVAVMNAAALSVADWYRRMLLGAA